MGWQRSHDVLGPLPNKLHSSWLIWSGGVPTIMDVASSCLAADSAHAASRTRGQTASATLSATDGSHGRRQNHSTMDNARDAHLPLAKGFRLSATQARCGSGAMAWGGE